MIAFKKVENFLAIFWCRILSILVENYQFYNSNCSAAEMAMSQYAYQQSDLSHILSKIMSYYTTQEKMCSCVILMFYICADATLSASMFGDSNQMSISSSVICPCFHISCACQYSIPQFLF